MYSTYECTCRIKLDTHFVSDFESRNKRNRWDEKEDIEFVVSSGSMLCKTSRNLRLTPNWNHAPLGFRLLPAHFRPPDHHKFIGGGQPPSLRAAKKRRLRQTKKVAKVTMTEDWKFDSTIVKMTKGTSTSSSVVGRRRRRRRLQRGHFFGNQEFLR